MTTHGAFHGFVRPTTADIPAEFFTHVLPRTQNMAELKVVSYALWRTLGFNNWLDWIALSQFEDGVVIRDPDTHEVIERVDSGTGLSRASVVAGLKLAVEHGYLRKRILCPDCAREAQPVPVTRKFRRKDKAKTEMLDTPPVCPHCAAKLKGREKVFYGPRWKIGHQPATSPRQAGEKYRSVLAAAGSLDSKLGGSLESKPGGSLDSKHTIFYPSDLTLADASGATSAPSDARSGLSQTETPAASTGEPEPRIASGRSAGIEPLPQWRERVIADLKAHPRPRDRIGIVTKNLGRLLGFDENGMHRTTPEKADYAAVGQLIREFGGPFVVWKMACRIAGQEIDGAPLDYLRAALQRDKQRGASRGQPWQTMADMDAKDYRADETV